MIGFIGNTNFKEFLIKHFFCFEIQSEEQKKDKKCLVIT